MLISTWSQGGASCRESNACFHADQILVRHLAGRLTHVKPLCNYVNRRSLSFSLSAILVCMLIPLARTCAAQSIVLLLCRHRCLLSVTMPKGAQQHPRRGRGKRPPFPQTLRQSRQCTAASPFANRAGCGVAQACELMFATNPEFACLSSSVLRASLGAGGQGRQVCQPPALLTAAHCVKTCR